MPRPRSYAVFCLKKKTQWHQTTVLARGVQDVTTHAPLRSRRTKAKSVYHVRVLRDGDSPTSPLKDTRLSAVACKRWLGDGYGCSRESGQHLLPTRCEDNVPL